jgi:hypothetical protein
VPIVLHSADLDPLQQQAERAFRSPVLLTTPGQDDRGSLIDDLTPV